MGTATELEIGDVVRRRRGSRDVGRVVGAVTCTDGRRRVSVLWERTRTGDWGPFAYKYHRRETFMMASSLERASFAATECAHYRGPFECERWVLGQDYKAGERCCGQCSLYTPQAGPLLGPGGER
jgi:hypothetical protein